MGNVYSCQMWPDDPQQAELAQVIGSAMRQPVSFEVVGYTVRMRDMPDGNGGKKQVPQANFIVSRVSLPNMGQRVA